MIALTIELQNGNKLVVKHHNGWVKTVEMVLKNKKDETIAFGYADKEDFKAFAKSL